MRMPARPKLLRPLGADRGHLRLAPCRLCAGRRRILVEVAGNVRGRCLDCGAELLVPFATERLLPHMIVGRGGQAIVAGDAGD